jgi:CelD/BcsL family acetyltransferase involved in cellulose biosynthesis
MATNTISVTDEVKVEDFWEDVPLAGVGAGLRAQITQASAAWYATPDFCELYSPLAATRLRFIRSSSGRVLRAFCYHRSDERKALVFGPTELPTTSILSLPTALGCSQVEVLRMTDDPADSMRKLGCRISVRAMSNDMVVTLPKRHEDYIKSLGPQTRKHLPYYLRRAQKEFGPSFDSRLFKNSAITFSSFTSLVQLNRSRIEQKGGYSAWTEDLVQRRSSLIARSGVFLGIYSGERLLAGTASYFHKADAYLALIGHTPEFDRYNLGNLALWQTINHLIDMGVQHYHLLWGASAYKEQFGASRVNLNEVVVFDDLGAALRWHTAKRAETAKTAILHLSRRLVSGVRKRLGLERGMKMQ